MPSELTGEAKEKFDLLRGHFKGVFELLKALGHCGYRPDGFSPVALDEAVNMLYSQVEEGRI
jgi:hypothetical protein